MIAFAVAVTKDEEYEQYAKPGIERSKEPDSELVILSATNSLFRSYNTLLAEARKLDDLEALVLLHQDTELVDDDFCGKIRTALADPEVAIVGCAGAIDVRSIAYWEGSVTWGSFVHRYKEYGGGEIQAISWDLTKAPDYVRTGEVDSIDGFAMAFSPWAVQELEFDESLGRIHGYDLDICLQARAKGKKVITTDFRAVHHHSLELIRDTEDWIQAHMTLSRKWEGSFPGIGYGAVQAGQDWEQRARRAEAEASMARKQAGAAGHVRDAKVRAIRRDLDRHEGSVSWRLTAPLRSVKARLKRSTNGGVSHRRPSVRP